MRERSEHALLNELAEWYGILLEYQDIWGNRQIASDQTKRAILAAMGVCADSVDAIRRELAVCMDAPWRQPCDPVMVVRAESAAGCWSFRIPSQEREDRDIQIRWDITDEAGARLRSEEAGPGLLPTEVRLVDGFRHVRYALPLPTGLTIVYYALVVRGVSPSQRVEGTLRLWCRHIATSRLSCAGGIAPGDWRSICTRFGPRKTGGWEILEISRSSWTGRQKIYVPGSSV